MQFEWDAQKRRDNLHKHGFDFDDAWRIFEMPMLTILDDRQEYGEERWIGIGLLNTRVVYVVYTEQAEDVIRIISLRKALIHERIAYTEFIRDRLGPH